MNDIDLDGSEWDAVIVGTGMGGATFGYALARAGWRVLFCERGRSSLAGRDALRDVYPEMRFGEGGRDERDVLSAAGRYVVPIDDLSSGRSKRFLPFMGMGTGGSSALYGMVLERFFPADFEPRRHYPDAEGSTLPERWPITYADLLPYYEAAERLYRVRGTRDPLRPDASMQHAEPPPMSAAARELGESLASQGLHPYQLPLACEYVAGCRGCQGYLCGSGCKNDSARVCLAPALAAHGARLVDECEVVRIDADRERVTGVICRRRGKEFRVSGRIVALAAGALATPSLLLQSRSTAWPDGVANDSGLVGHNLMRHYIDLYAVFPKARPDADGNAKEFGCNDLYLADGVKLGAIQSFGKLPPGAMIANDLQRDLRQQVHPAAAAAFGLVKPIMRPIFDLLFSRATILATIIEDLPQPENRVLPPAGAAGEGISISYRVNAREGSRIERMREHMKRLLRPYRHLLIKQAENNERIAHACGTCRFGDDPASSVLDANNRAHGLANLYVVDASFFPSSGGTNPALTIAANALRVADHLLGEAGAKAVA
ncbi:FAD-dependent oxidoreductase [Azoarcus sp. KH32C]|uniref:FAD-dependent oxidoreductase n=1 Tax=Azoarcus sp. KH32C TaxID=748247 RepID=UPI0002386FB4|nr:FAD-dependent oxidoreductase [Azoarcus sp. KH32C]BAL23417.1 glucose-methanol-choline oxidoreductase [Azoarcus sp. KH32C]